MCIWMMLEYSNGGKQRDRRADRWISGWGHQQLALLFISFLASATMCLRVFFFFYIFFLLFNMYKLYHVALIDWFNCFSHWMDGWLIVPIFGDQKSGNKKKMYSLFSIYLVIFGNMCFLCMVHSIKKKNFISFLPLITCRVKSRK
mgnify:CR=1 FL=1